MKRIIPIFHSLSKSMRAIHKLSCDGVSVVQSTIVYEISLIEEFHSKGSGESIFEEHFDVLAKETIEVHTILVSYFIYRSSLTYEN